MSVTYVSFYAGPGYAEEAAGLRESLDKFGLKHAIIELNDTGSWVTNCAEKPLFLRMMREWFTGPLVWLDADARVQRYPELFDEWATAWPPIDIGFCTVPRFPPEQMDPVMASGTLYFGDTPRAQQLLSAWRVAQAETPDDLDQTTLSNAVNATRGAFVIGELPESYCAIFDRDVPDPVILHRQASRKLRKRQPVA